MKIFYIEKQGVYPQGVYGVFDNLDQAKTAAIYFAKSDRDSYHTWYVMEAELNTRAKDGEYEVGDVVFQIDKAIAEKLPA